jgi:formate hydrogenlyase subunit 3/multisubunit Na+/H+ antiporter MnhD subunit
MSAILVTMVALPLVMLLLLAHRPLRPLIVKALAIAPMPGLLVLPAAWQSGQWSTEFFGTWSLVLDQPAALMLVASSVLWCIGGFAASNWLRGRSGQGGFAMWWLMTLAGSLGVFVAADVASFYLFYAAASLPAYGLIVFGGGTADFKAGRVTLAAALLGEALILAAFVMLVAGASGQGLLIRDLVSSLAESPYRDPVILLVIVGFGLKIGLVPLHGWMPLSYGAGPLVATAVLSGATSKAGLMGLIRFLPLDAPHPYWGGVLLAAGLLSALYGAIIGLTQNNPRSVLAYSSVSQLGQMAAVLGLGLAAGNAAAAVMVAFYAVYHVLTKGGLFLALGVDQRMHAGAAANLNLIVAIVLSLGFAGLPLTGGALGKLAVKPIIGDGAASLVFAIAAIGSTLLMLHFIRLHQGVRRDLDMTHGNLTRSAWFGVAISAMVLPWSLFAAVTAQPLSSAMSLNAVVELAWPVAAGAVLWWGILRSGLLIPRLAAGDVWEWAFIWVLGLLQTCANAIAWFERRSREWAVSAACMVLVIALLALALTSALSDRIP